MFLTVTPRTVIRRLALAGGLSILIKTANAFLAYAMLLLIARVLTAEQYGIFAVAFSVAMTTAFVSGLGQPSAVMRFWPQWVGQDETLKARSVLRFNLNLTIMGMGSAAALILLGGSLNLFETTTWSLGVAAGTALFTLAFGCSEFSSAALRAQGYVVKALAPRDIAWRLIVCGLFGAAALAGIPFDAASVLLTIGSVLAAIICPQVIMLYRSSAGGMGIALSGEDRKQISRYSVIMWVHTSVQLARSYAGVVIVSGFLGAEAAGAYFAADRTANMLSFLLLAVNLVSAPLISRHYHSDHQDLVRLIVGLSGLVAGLVALVGLVFLFVLGSEILAFFNPEYGTFLPVLLILGCGQLFLAATGPVGSLLVLSGHERVSLVVGVSVGIVSVCSQAIGGLYWGPVGVAVGATGGTVISKAITVAYAWRILGIDSTGLTLALQACGGLVNVVSKYLGLKR